MASLAPFLAFLCLGLLCLAASGALGLHLVPTWLLAPLLQMRAGHIGSNHDDRDSDRPEILLLQRLKHIDSERNPEIALALHTALGKLLASGEQNKMAMHHFEAARDAALQGTDPDAVLSARIELAETYIDEGRALDAQRELVAASGVMANHFVEQRVRWQRAYGRVKFELGLTNSALQYFEVAQQYAVLPEDVVRVACDISMVYTCLGQSNESLHTLQNSLDLLQSKRVEGQDGGMPATLRFALAAEVHLRLAEAYNSMKKSVVAKAHYEKALYFAQKSPNSKFNRVSAIQTGLSSLRAGARPELRCPRLPRAPWDIVENVASMNDSAFMAKVKVLLAEKNYNLVESELKTQLRGQSRPYKTVEALAALNILGDVFRNQGNYAKAAKHFRQALHAAIVCCGAGNPEAQKAYEGLNSVRGELSGEEERIAIAAIHRYDDVVNKRNALDDPPRSRDLNLEKQTESEQQAFV